MMTQQQIDTLNKCYNALGHNKKGAVEAIHIQGLVIIKTWSGGQGYWAIPGRDDWHSNVRNCLESLGETIRINQAKR